MDGKKPQMCTRPSGMRGWANMSTRYSSTDWQVVHNGLGLSMVQVEGERLFLLAKTWEFVRTANGWDIKVTSWEVLVLQPGDILYVRSGARRIHSV